MSFPKYPEYKDTGVRWLGKMPSHWRLVPLWSCFSRTKRTGFEDKVLLSVYRDYGVIPKASRDDNFNKPSDDLSAYQLVNEGDLVVNKMKAWQGSVAISDHRGIVSPAYFVYDSLHGEVPRFFHYLMRSERYITGYLSISEGVRVNQWDMDPALHSRMPLLIPGKNEQETIADFLDNETVKIDALVAEQEQLITLLKEKRQAVITRAVTKGLDTSVPMKDSGVVWLGEVPVHWQVKQLRHVARIVRGASPRPAGDPKFFSLDESDETNVPWVTVAEITKDDSLYLTGVIEFLTPLGADASQRFERDTVIFSNSGATLGVPKILAIDCCANDGVLAFKNLDRQVHREFLYFFLSTTTERLRTEMRQGGGQPNLNTDIVKNIGFAVPSLDEQVSIVNAVQKQTARFNDLICEAQRGVGFLQERRSALISAAVTGQIDVRGLTTAKEAA
jgi:type I restriction enzyme S subunit